MDSQGDHKPGPVGKGAAGDEYKKPQLVVADGLLVMPGALQHWEKIMSFQARPDDTFIASYPKSGLMWTTQVMNMIKLQGDVEAYKVNKTLIPFLEFCRPDEEPAVEKINNLPSPRVINIHAPISHISKSILENKCKVICVLRNPKDVAVSFYHFHTFNNMLPNPGTWSEFLQNFMIGKVGFNSWFDHVKGWWSLREQPNIFFLFYEGMKKDLGYEAGRLASFLGHDLSPEAIKNLVEQLSFNAMKAKMDEKFSNMTSPAGFTFKQFLRKASSPSSMDSQGDHKPGPVGKGAAGDEYKKPQLVVADGLLVMPGALQHWEKIMSFQARPDDTFIASYPKSGLVWTTQVMNMIKLQGDVEAYKVKKTLIPFLEFCRPDEEPAVEKINNLPSPRVINIHAPISHISKSILENKCKVICVLRNPKDVAVSFYHFHTFNNMLPNPGTWSEFLQNFMIGKVMCNSWFDHVKGWWSLREQPNIFFLFYEGMKKDLGYEAGRLASFLGQDLSPEAIKNLVEQLSFNAMKANMDEMFPNVTSPAGFTFKQFLRKGQVGDWKNHFTVAQNEVMDQLITDQLQGTSLDFCYEL